MTIEEISWMAWEMLGEPTDLDPTANTVSANDPWTTNEDKWLYMVSRAADAVATFKAGNGRHFRYKGDDLVGVFNVPFATAFTLSAEFATTDSYMTTTGLTQDALKDYVLVENVANPTQFFKCVGNSTTNVYTDKRPSPAIASATAIRGGIPRIDLQGTTVSGGTQTERVMEVLGVQAHIRDLSSSTGDRLVTLDPLPRQTRNETSSFYGTPKNYWRNGRYLWMDGIPVYEDSMIVYADIKKFPTAATTFATDEPDVPEAFHYAVMLWTCAWGFNRYMDPAMRKDKRAEFREEMQTRVTEFMVEFDHNDKIGGTVRRT